MKQGTAQSLEADVLQGVGEIIHHMQMREYVKANDAYLRLSIGNAAWPIGVTMVRYLCHPFCCIAASFAQVGIHDRSAREKIGGHSVAHVLNDEVSRKYIQSLKRCVEFLHVVDASCPYVAAQAVNLCTNQVPPIRSCSEVCLTSAWSLRGGLTRAQDGLRCLIACRHCGRCLMYCPRCKRA